MIFSGSRIGGQSSGRSTGSTAFGRRGQRSLEIAQPLVGDQLTQIGLLSVTEQPPGIENRAVNEAARPAGPSSELDRSPASRPSSIGRVRYRSSATGA